MNKLLGRQLLVVFFSLLCFSAGSSSAAVILVTNTNDSGAGSLRQALTNANDADIISFNLPGSAPWTINLTTELAANANNVHIIGNTNNPESVIINGNGTGRIFLNETASESITFSGLTMQNAGVETAAIEIYGNVTVNDCVIRNNLKRGVWVWNQGSFTATNTTISGNQGNGIYSSGGKVSLTNCIIENNDATASTTTSGGGINVGPGTRTDSVTISITDTVFSGNTATAGGGINFSNSDGYWTLELDNVTLDNNQATSDGGGLNGSAKMSGCRITNNTAGLNGGGISSSPNSSSVLEITNSIIRNNATTSGSGGGVRVEGGTAIISRSEFSGNTSMRSGGGLYGGGNWTVENTTFSGNSADNYGGGLYFSGSSSNKAYINYCTITDNITDNNKDGLYAGGGGIYQSGTVELHLKGTIVAGNTRPVNVFSVVDDCFGTFYSDGYNLIGFYANQTGFSDGVNFDKVGETTTLNSQLGPLADNGGPTLTHALLENSPALSAAERTPPLSVDQRGEIRPCGISTDMGALESCSQNGTPQWTYFPWTMFLPTISNNTQP